MSEVLCCQTCGGNLVKEGDLYVCSYCCREYSDIVIQKAYQKLEQSLSDKFGSLVHEEIIKSEQAKFRPLLTQLWEKTHEEYIDSDEILRICRQIKEIYPDHFQANFYEVANCGSVSQINAFINSIDVSENYCYVEDVVVFLLKSLELGNVAPLTYLVERAYKNTDMEKFEHFSTLIEEEAQKVDGGTYDANLPRDVFVAYSSKDAKEVLRLVESCESQGISCFIAMRNLRHGRGAKANYETELQNAMDGCKVILFVSSKNSRRNDCDALKVELPYIKKKDLENIPAGLKNDYTSQSVLKYKKLRLEYRLDNEATPFADRYLKEFFAGLEYSKSLDDTLGKLSDILIEGKNFQSDRQSENSYGNKQTNNTHGGSFNADKINATVSGAFDALKNTKDQLVSAFKKVAVTKTNERKSNDSQTDYFSQSPSEKKPSDAKTYEEGYCDKWVTLLLCLFLGVLGGHKFYEKKIGLGVVYIFTYGFFFIGWLIDVLTVLSRKERYYKIPGKKGKK